MKRFLLWTLTVLLATVSFAQVPDQPSRTIGKISARSAVKQFSHIQNGYLINQSTYNKTTITSIGKTIKETTGNTMITEEPIGNKVTYTRNGLRAFSYDGGATVEYEPQEGIIQVIYDKDGKTVYFKDLISATAMLGSWVKGTLSEDKKTISLPLGQNVYYAEEMGCYMQLALVKKDDAQQTFIKDEKAQVATFTIEDKQLKLNGSSENYLFGLTFSTDGTWAGYGDYNTLYKELPDKLVELPQGLQKRFHYMEGISIMGEPYKGYVFIARDGNDVYMQGACTTTSDGWVKGSIKDNNLIFPKGQLTGFYLDFYPVYFVGAKENSAADLDLCDVTLVYDETSKKYTADCFIVENANKEFPDIFNATTDAFFYEGPDIVFNSEIIRQQPEGELKQYARSGEATMIYWDYLLQVSQNGLILDLVTAPDDKTIYMKNPVSQLNANTWVKGTKEGNRITIPLYQRVEFNAAEGYGLMTAVLNKQKTDSPNNMYQLDTNVKQVVFTINDDGTITPEGIDENKVIGLIYTDNLNWSGYNDWNTVYHPITEKPTTIPEGIRQEKWAYQYFDGLYDYGHFVKVAFDKDKMYIAGIVEDLPESAIVGTVQGDKVTFASNQFLGFTNGTLVYFNAGKESKRSVTDPTTGESAEETVCLYLPELTFNLDKTNQLMTTNQNLAIAISIGQAEQKEGTEISHFKSYSYNPRFNLHEDKATVPADPVILEFDDSQFAVNSTSSLMLDIKAQDTKGRYIDPEQLAYQIFLFVNGKIEPFVFYTDEYKNITKNMEVIPYNFTDNNNDIMQYGSTLYFYQTGFEDIGVQVINYSGNTETRSKLVWFKGLPTGSNSIVNGQAQPEHAVYHTLSGIRTHQPSKGIYLKTVTYSDGSVKTTKINVK